MKTMQNDIADYFSNFEGTSLSKLHQMRELLLSLVPEGEEAIKYGIPTIIYHGNLVHYAGFKKHIGFYPVPSALIEFEKDLAKYKQGKGSIQFPLDEELPVELIKKMVEFRIKENLTNEEKKKKK